MLARLFSLSAAILWLASALAAEDALDRYVDLRTGSFSSAAQARQDDRYAEVIWHIAERPSSSADERWLYLEAWMAGAETPYLQRMSRHHLEPDGTIVAQPFRIGDGEALIGAWEAPDRLAEFDLNGLEAIEGCALEISRTGPDRFEGQTRGARCRNGHRGASYAVSRFVLEADGAMNWDRGFAADGSLVWGPAAGGYRFVRLDADAPVCDDPVRMLVFGTIEDRAAFGAYAQALMESGLYPRTGGYWMAVSPALEVFEGDPPAGRGVVISHFPCLAAAREFWYDPQYQEEIIPLRSEISEFEVLVLPAVPVPEYAR